MLAGHAHKERRVPRANKSDAMMDNDKFQRKIRNRSLYDLIQLMLGHRPMRFVFYPLDLSPLLQLANNAPEIDNRSGGKIDSLFRRF